MAFSCYESPLWTQNQIFDNLGMTHDEFLRFDGGNLGEWTRNCYTYFRMHPVPEFEKVRLASIHFEGKAHLWFQSLHTFLLQLNWGEFQREACDEFKQLDNEEVIWKFKGLTQIGDVNSYQIRFEKWLSLLLEQTRSECEYFVSRLINGNNENYEFVNGLGEEFFVSRFINGLQEEIGEFVFRFQPNTLDHAIYLAKIQEDNLIAVPKEVKCEQLFLDFSQEQSITLSTPAPILQTDVQSLDEKKHHISKLWEPVKKGLLLSVEGLEDKDEPELSCGSLSAKEQRLPEHEQIPNHSIEVYDARSEKVENTIGDFSGGNFSEIEDMQPKPIPNHSIETYKAEIKEDEMEESCAVGCIPSREMGEVQQGLVIGAQQEEKEEQTGHEDVDYQKEFELDIQHVDWHRDWKRVEMEHLKLINMDFEDPFYAPINSVSFNGKMQLLLAVGHNVYLVKMKVLLAGYVVCLMMMGFNFMCAAVWNFQWLRKGVG